MAIQNVGWNFVEMASKQGKKLMSIPLKDNKTAKVLWNDNAVDCFIMKDGKLVNGKGATGSTPYIQNEMAGILDKLQTIVAPGVDMLKIFMNACFK